MITDAARYGKYVVTEGKKCRSGPMVILHLSGVGPSVGPTSAFRADQQNSTGQIIAMAEYSLDGRVIIVTGAGRGLGRAMTEALTEAGANVVAAAHISDDFPELEALCADNRGQVHCVEADIRETADCDRIIAAALETFGGLHGLVNNAGLTFTYIWPDGYRRPEWTENRRFPRFYLVDDEKIQNVINTNFVGANQMARRAAPIMVEQGWGRIVNVTTMYPTMTRPGSSPYGPSKAALAGLAEEMKQMSREAETPFLIEPEQYKAPIVWLMSDATDGISGMRYDAKPWDASKPAPEEAERIGSKAGVLLYKMPD
jgi:3-oxoacyl-[acyl-carrier protein] reductase